MEELYKKVGRRYVPATDPWAFAGLREGHWHVIVRPGSVTVRTPIWPNRMAVCAAIEVVRDAMMEAMQGANESIPRGITPKEQRAVKAYRDIMGKDAAITFSGVSMWNLIDTGIKVLQEKLE